MKKTILFCLFIFGLMAIVPNVSTVSASGENWLTGWDYRQGITVRGSSGAGSDYQVFLYVTYNSDMQADFDDLRFTDDDGDTLLDYWLEEYIYSIYSLFWIEVADDLGSDQIIYMYYGNDAVSTMSNGTATFVFYEDWTVEAVNASIWTTVDNAGSISWSAVDANHGTVAKVEGGVGTDQQGYQTIASGTAPTSLMFRAKIESTLEASQRIRIGSTSLAIHGFAVIQSDAGTETFYVYDDDSNEDTQAMDASAFDNYYTFEITRDGTYVKLYRDGSLIETASWQPDTKDQVYGMFSCRDSEFDLYVDWFVVRKYIVSEPVAIFGLWNEQSPAKFYFNVPFDMWGYNTALIILGLVMIPVSTIYLAYGVKHDRSSDRLFYGLIIFFLGFGLLIGGIMP